jgi:hypothetical protein
MRGCEEEMEELYKGHLEGFIHPMGTLVGSIVVDNDRGINQRLWLRRLCVWEGMMETHLPDVYVELRAKGDMCEVQINSNTIF